VRDKDRESFGDGERELVVGGEGGELEDEGEGERRGE